MNNFNKLLIFLMVALMVQSNISAMDDKQESAEGMIAKSKRLINDLKEYRKCRGTQQGCPPELVQRVKAAGMQIAAGTALLGAALGGAGVYQYHKYKTRKWWQSVLSDVAYNTLVSMYGFEHELKNVRIIDEAFNGEKITENEIAAADPKAVNAAIFIAKMKKHLDVAKFLEDELKKLPKKK